MSLRFPSRPRYLAFLDEEELSALLAEGEIGQASAAETIIEQSQPQDRLYFVASGRAIVRVAHGGTVTEVAELRAGECFGEMSVFHPGPASASVIASERLDYWSISKDKLEGFLADHPELAARFYTSIITELATRMRTLNENLPEGAKRVSEGWW
ncbi:MAG: cyclic nucleotide-binding domain-containing protein [Verrucomicrobiota bacterium]